MNLGRKSLTLVLGVAFATALFAGCGDDAAKDEPKDGGAQGVPPGPATRILVTGEEGLELVLAHRLDLGLGGYTRHSASFPSGLPYLSPYWSRARPQEGVGTSCQVVTVTEASGWRTTVLQASRVPSREKDRTWA